MLSCFLFVCSFVFSFSLILLIWDVEEPCTIAGAIALFDRASQRRVLQRSGEGVP